jgi:hypothetical protein
MLSLSHFLCLPASYLNAQQLAGLRGLPLQSRLNAAPAFMHKQHNPSQLLKIPVPMLKRMLHWNATPSQQTPQPQEHEYKSASHANFRGCSSTLASMT